MIIVHGPESRERVPTIPYGSRNFQKNICSVGGGPFSSLECVAESSKSFLSVIVLLLSIVLAGIPLFFASRLQLLFFAGRDTSVLAVQYLFSMLHILPRHIPRFTVFHGLGIPKALSILKQGSFSVLPNLYWIRLIAQLPLWQRFHLLSYSLQT